MNIIARTLPVFFITLCLTTGISAMTFFVDTTGDSADHIAVDGQCLDIIGTCSLRAAIMEANAQGGSHTIILPAGIYTHGLVGPGENANFGGDWDVTAKITITGAGEGATFLQAASSPGIANERVIDVLAGGDLTLTNLTVRNGRFSSTDPIIMRGAGIQNSGSLTLNSVTVRDNELRAVGNIYPNGAGIYSNGPSLILINSTVTANQLWRFSQGPVAGAGIYSAGPSVTITGSSISGNTGTATTSQTIIAIVYGAGLYAESLSTLTATDSHFDNNTGNGADLGGSLGSGMYVISGTTPGVGVINATGCTFNNNVGSGGPRNQGVGIMLTAPGGQVRALAATFDRVSVSGNTGNHEGVGVYAMMGNSGGNITLNFLNSTIAGNSGALNGGGMFLLADTATTGAQAINANFTNSTISGNTSIGSGGGIGFRQEGGAPVNVNLNFTTVAGNRANSDNSGAETGGGIYHTAGTVNLKSSVIADNSVGTGGTAPDVSGSLGSQNYNHIEDLTGAIFTPAANDTSGFDPQLGLLQNNGGPTATHLPAVNSLVLDSIPIGQNGCGTDIFGDQRGFGRPFGSGCDKGSVERGATLAAGPWTLSGTVMTTTGIPIRNVAVEISGGNLPAPVTVFTGNFGTYQFTNLSGNEYTVTVTAKRFHFNESQQIISLGSNIANADFVANAPFTRQPSGQNPKR